MFHSSWFNMRFPYRENPPSANMHYHAQNIHHQSSGGGEFKRKSFRKTLQGDNLY